MSVNKWANENEGLLFRNKLFLLFWENSFFYQMIFNSRAYYPGFKPPAVLGLILDHDHVTEKLKKKG